MIIEIAYAIDKSVRLVQSGAWYIVQLPNSRGRWVEYTKSRKHNAELEIFLSIAGG